MLAADGSAPAGAAPGPHMQPPPTVGVVRPALIHLPERQSYMVEGEEWRVGDRYDLVRLLGSGSFSTVCLAVEKETGEEVALKRIGDVLASPEQAKKVLREVCMLRRLGGHPSVVGLRGALVRPASRGPCRLVDGALVPTSIDVYLALEHCAGGDLFSLRGPLPAAEVRSLMRQAAGGLAFLHRAGVWHRDIKSSNLFLRPAPPGAPGRWVVKIGDFGSARSCWCSGGAAGGGPRPHPAPAPALTAARSDSLGREAVEVPGGVDDAGHGGAPAPAAATTAQPGRPPLPPWAARAADLAARPADAGDDAPARAPAATASTGGGGGFRPPLTRCVATPCYRAPEVVMSRGGYTAAIDAWSLGAVFGELLQRVPRPGAAPPPPSLRVAPLFAVRGGLPATPTSASSLDERTAAAPTNPAAHPAARTELDALFDVVGTPSDADIAAVPSRAWRAHLRRAPHRAPTLMRRLGGAGEVAVSLLASLLAFDPARRASPAEALRHEYFTGPAARAEGGGEPWPAEVAACGWAGGADAAVSVAVVGGEDDDDDDDVDDAASTSSAVSSPVASPKRVRAASPRAGTRAAAKVAAARPPEPDPARPASYHTEADPARALALLEGEMEAAGAGAAAVAADAGGAGQLEAARRGAAGLARLRALLEAECAAAEAGRGVVAAAAAAVPPPPPHPAFPSGWRKGGRSGDGAPSPPPQVDGGGPPCALAAGRARVPRTADAAAGALDPAGFLAPGRHGEWVAPGGRGAGGAHPPGTPAPGSDGGGAWGVSVLPPGMEGADAAVAEAVRRQQAR